MVHFLLGRSGTGKSQELLRRVEENAKSGQRTVVVVPEQFTLETERKYYRALGAALLKYVTVTSFTRIAHQVFRLYGGAAGDYADDSIKLILMSLSIDEVRDRLTVYGKAAGRTQFAKTMLEQVAELKNADLDSAAFLEKAGRSAQPLLREKARDIAEIYAVYDAMLGAQYRDQLDDLSRAVGKIREHGFFAGSTVFLDEFKGFTQRELNVIRAMMETAAEVTVSLCLDPDEMGEHQVFAFPGKTYRRLLQLARISGQRVEKPVVLREGRRFTSPELSCLEQAAFAQKPAAYFKECGMLSGKRRAFSALLAANEYEEADYIAASIRALVQEEGLRYRDIVVVARDLGPVQSCLENAFVKYDVPYYLDQVRQIGDAPLIRLVELCLACLSGGLDSDDLIALLKCGFCGYTVEEIAALENYLFLWDLRGEDWREPFTRSIFGTDQPEGEEERSRNAAALASFNQIRERVFGALERFRSRARDAGAGEVCRALAQLLEELGVRETINRQIGELAGSALAEQAQAVQESRRVWEICEEILRILTETAGKRRLAPKRFAELFSLLAQNFDLGTLPQTVDCVIAGSAERIRTDSPKVLFLAEANDRQFPYVPENSGLFTDPERRSLQELGLELSSPMREKLQEETFIAYKTLAIPSARLYVLARKADMKGSAMAPSYLFGRFRRIFGDEVVQDTEELDRLYFCRTKTAAFSVLAYQFRQDTPLTASLRHYFSMDPLYQERMEAIQRNLERKDFHLESPETARALYGEPVVLSPTQVEKYQLCRFRYFCEHGLRVQPRKKVQLYGSGRGLVIHNVLYAVCSQIRDYSVFDREAVQQLVDRELQRYLEESMGGQEHRSKRFLYLYRRLRRTLMTVLERLFGELAQSQFAPVAFEYQIGAPGHVRPLAVQSGVGLRLYLRGTVDRIDAYETPSGRRYLRVIDYKSGDQRFSLSDLFNGVNLQMFLYLMCLEKNGAQLYGQAKGAGVLYMPAGNLRPGLGRDAGGQEVEEELAGHYRMSGVVLDDELVLRAMERELSGRYTPVAVTRKAYEKNDQLKENVFIDRHANEEFFSSESMKALLTAEQLGRLYGKLERTLSAMAEELYGGRIEAVPLERKGKRPGCEYCSFQTVCGFEEGKPVRQYEEMDKKELFERLAAEEESAPPAGEDQ